jgi:ubiquitin carboxyl-terminal hydrolase 4/11/15
MMTTELPGGNLSDDDFDDNASNKAVGGGDMSDSDYRMHSLIDSPIHEPVAYPGTPVESTIADLPPLDDDDEELPVVELHVSEEERLSD